MINLTKRKKAHADHQAGSPPASPQTRWIVFRSIGRLFSREQKTITHLSMALPGVLWIFVFSYLPMLGLIVAFKNYRFDLGIWGSQWVGLRNFRFLFATRDAIQITYNTITLNGLFILVNLVVALSIAILLHEVYSSQITRYHQTALLFPYFISWVIVSVFVFALLDPASGMVNRWLIHLGLQKIRWYSEPELWPGILTLVNLWKGVGFWSIIYFAGILNISPEYYEAAKVDGANGWQQIWHITLPLLLPLITINTLLAIGRIFYADFGLFYQVTRNTPILYPTTDVIDTYVYRALRTTGDISMASAAGFYQALVGFCLVMIANWIVRKIDPDKALF